ncbi:MAG: 30S ribosomal protein S1, partial [Candidatus Aminicenantes bacterium]|nr:30S ribosomal protein S1 [Candidatus Aminicenantes bacterium]
PGSLVKGKVIKVTSSHILVDIGFKSEGMIPLEEFGPENERDEIKPGDEVEAILERSDPKEGYIILSKKRANAIRAMDNLEKAYKTRSWIVGKVDKKIRNGYEVDVGIITFMPDSHADVKSIKDPESLLGNRYKFKVIRFERKTENAVLSRKAFMQDEREKKKRIVFDQLKKGLKVQGTVRTLTNFGAFVDIGGVEGLLHISDMSWGKINHPSEVLKVGDEAEVIILDFDEKEDRISLGYKQMSDDPWENIIDRYMEGQKIEGKVVSLTDFGAFVELEPGVEGLVHISDLTWSRKLIHPKKILSVGEEVMVTILSINPESKRISLGLKHSLPHPLEEFQQKYSPGSRVKGKITSITDFGGFLEVEKGIEGLIHISDISWKKIRHPSDVLKQGDEIEVVILNIDVDKQKLSLGIKQLEGDIWEDFFKRQRMGDIVHVKIIRIADFGVFVEITPGIEGVVFLSELDEHKIENPAEVFKIGEERNAKILKLNQKEKRISLSFRQAVLDQQKMEYQKYAKSQDGSHTLGDIMRDQLKAIDLKPKQKDSGKKEKADKPTAEKKTKTAPKKKGTAAAATKEKTAEDKPAKKSAAKEKTAKKEQKEKPHTKNKKKIIVNKAEIIEEDTGDKEEKND